MGRIRQLDTKTANMIAAGEVVERPMGVVKELVENAIDAGATRIDVQLEEGGLTKLVVSDNGCGMDSADAEMAFQRHATSKIQNENDLWSIHTLGFRGEALPSIAAVAKVTLSTSEGNEGTRIIIEYGKLQSAASYPCNQGTEIAVEGLFYQTPARLKHMRSSAYETSLIQDVISRFALSHPEISFHLVSNGREIFRSSGQDNLLEVVFQVFGRTVAENAVEIDTGDFDYTLKGYVIKPVVSRASRSMMYIFLNGRMVRTYKLYKAVQEAYETYLPKGRYPLCVLSVEMDPHLLDVNVHPSKWEVRLSKENQLEYLIRDSVKQALQSEVLAKEHKAEPSEQVYYEPLSFDTEQLMPKKETAPVIEKKKEEVILPAEKREEITEDTYQAILKEAAEDERLLKEAMAETVQEDKPEYEPEERKTLPVLEVIGQYHNRYIICAAENGLVLIDQQAAQQRIQYEEIRESLGREAVMIPCLIPLTVHTSADIVARCEEINERLESIHIHFEPFGSDTLIVHELPSWLHQDNSEEFLNDLIDDFKNDRNDRSAKVDQKRILLLASKNRVSSAQSLSMAEMQKIVDGLNQVSEPYYAPSGRAILVIFDEKEIAKEFRR